MRSLTPDCTKREALFESRSRSHFAFQFSIHLAFCIYVRSVGDIGGDADTLARCDFPSLKRRSGQLVDGRGRVARPLARPLARSAAAKSPRPKIRSVS